MYASASSLLPTVDSQIEIAGDGAHIRSYNAQEPVFCEGDDAGFLYEVIEGVVCNSRLLADGRRHVISFCYPGDLIGLGQEDQFRFSCDAVSPARLRSIPTNAILSAIKDRPELGEKLLQSAATQLAALHDHSVMLGCKSAIEKVTSFLLTIARQDSGADEIHLPMTRTDIADYLGLTVETVSRNLTKLRLQGVIDMPEPHTVMMRDPDRLEGLANGDELDL